ncbi:MAG: hypothetical protein KGI06_03250 [Candidatus Micrarchaeota archaeon]|nr:hypothetical protein [Candidatus Micrarchaeota archaeon]
MTKSINRSGYLEERIKSSKQLETIGAFILLDLVLVSLRNPFVTFIGVIVSILILIFAIYSYIGTKSKYLKMRARYMVFFVILALFTYYGSYGIPRGDTALMIAIGESLVTATSISAVFAGTIYEKMKEATITNKHRMPKELIDIVARLAIYPMIISIAAVFTAILALVFSSSHFLFSIILVNLTITSILLALITSVELLKEDLERQLD